MNLTNKFIDAIYEINQNTINTSLKQCVKRCLIDYLGVTICGSYIAEKRIKQILKVFSENGSYSILGLNTKTSLQTALLANGISSHVAELDDGVISGIIHPGAPVFTALLAIAEKENITWDDFVRGVIVGYESSVRIANAIQPSHKKCGYHASCTCGTIGVALGIASMLNYEKDILKNTLSIAIASSHGTLKVLEDASELKPYNISSAAINGTIAALTAKSGFKGPEDAFMGEAGFFNQMTNNVNEESLWGNKDKSLFIENVYFKPYAACRYTHPSIEASIALKNKYNIDYKEIKQILVETYDLAVTHHDHTEIPNISSAKMSIPYSAAVSLITNNGGVDSYTDKYVFNKEVLDLARKVKVISCDSFSKMFPEKSCARMTITMEDLTKHLIVIDMPKGEPGNPLTDEDIRNKFISLCLFAGKSREEADDILNIINQENISMYKLISKIG